MKSARQGPIRRFLARRTEGRDRRLEVIVSNVTENTLVREAEDLTEPIISKPNPKLKGEP